MIRSASNAGGLLFARRSTAFINHGLFAIGKALTLPRGSMIVRSITRNCVARSWIHWGHEATGDTGRRYLTGAQINPFKSPNRKHPTMPSYYSTEFLHKGRS